VKGRDDIYNIKEESEDKTKEQVAMRQRLEEAEGNQGDNNVMMIRLKKVHEQRALTFKS
jgi:hypothetical protein